MCVKLFQIPMICEAPLPGCRERTVRGHLEAGERGRIRCPDIKKQGQAKVPVPADRDIL